MLFKRAESDSDVLILQADAGLNGPDGPDLVDALERHLDEGARKLVVDGGNLTTISSSGLSVLIRLHHRMRKRGGDMMLAGFHGIPQEALEMTRLDRVFPTHSTAAEATTAFREHEPV